MTLSTYVVIGSGLGILAVALRRYLLVINRFPKFLMTRRTKTSIAHPSPTPVSTTISEEIGALSFDEIRQRAVNALSKNDINRAEEYLRFLSSQPMSEDKTVEALTLYGEALFRQKKYDLAEATYQRILLMKTDEPIFYANIGEIYLHLEKPEKAEEAFQKALSLRPDEAEFMTGLVKAYRKLGKHEEARELHQKIVRKAG